MKLIQYVACSPFTDPGAEGECYDDTRTPVIPLIPIEDVAEESGSKTTAGEETGIQQLINIISDPEMVKKLMDGMQQKVRPPTPPTSAHVVVTSVADATTMVLPVKPPTSNSRPVAIMSMADATTTVLPTKPSTSKPDVEAIRKLIHDYGRRPQYASWNRPSMIASTSYRPSNVEDFKKTISICGVDHRWGKPYTGQHPSMLLPVTNLHEIEEQRLSRFGQHQGLRSTHSYPASFVTNPKPRQETCTYFGSFRGCRNGSKCRFSHHVSKKTMANGATKAAVNKFTKGVGNP